MTVKRSWKTLWSAVGLILMLAAACAGNAVPPTPSATPTRTWAEEEVSFSFGSDDLHGVLTLPTGEGPYPAIALISGSANASTGARNGASTRYFRDHARHMVRSGFAVLRYDPSGVGQSTGKVGFETLDERAKEALAALRYIQSRPDVQPGRVGLWGVSQGGWVIAMAAAQAPDEVSFIIADSAAGVSVAEQQVYSIEAQSRGADMSDESIVKAVLIGRLLIDWQLNDPIYRDVNKAEADALGDGPWTRFAALIYEPGEITAAQGLEQGIEILKSIQDEPWARFLYLRELYLPRLESVPPEQVLALKAMTGPNLLNDPKKYLNRVDCPVLAVFGEEDVLVPAYTSAALYRQYLTEAGNDDIKVVVIPGVGHAFGLDAPGYSVLLSDWRDHLVSDGA